VASVFTTADPAAVVPKIREAVRNDGTVPAAEPKNLSLCHGGDPERLFFNALNPLAAKGNSLQGFADVFQMVRLAENFDVDVAGLGQVRLDPNRILYYGHSQGSNVGGPAAAFEPDIHAIVLSGAGAHLMSSLLHKRSPVDVAGLIKLVFMDAHLGLDHPMLNLFQLYFDQVDGVNYGSLLARNPPDGVPAKDIFQTYGLGDTASPEQTMQAFARSMGLDIAPPILVEITGLGTYSGDFPVSGNVSVMGELRTQIMSQFDPQCVYDGHFVAQRDDAAKAQIAWFLASAAATGLAQLPAR